MKNKKPASHRRKPKKNHPWKNVFKKNSISKEEKDFAIYCESKKRYDK